MVGPVRADGLHEVMTVLQALDLSDRVALAPARTLRVDGFPDDTIVRHALEALAAEAGTDPRWRVRIRKRIPVAAGLGGGSSDAAAALRLANATLDRPLDPDALARLARELGADVPFFLAPGPKLGEDEGPTLTPLDLPQDYWVALVRPHGATKESSAAVYRAFDECRGERGYRKRREAVADALARVRRPTDLAALPANDLASSPLAEELRELGAFRADVTGAGPVVYGLFLHRSRAEAAVRALSARGRTWLTAPAWYV